MGQEMLTSTLSDYIQSTKYEKLPESVVVKVKECFIDFLGVALRGSMTKSGESIKAIIKPVDESTVIGQGKSSSLEAGLANGIFAHSMDLDDGHRIAQIHPGSCVIPAALATCESQNDSGEIFIESVVAGYQVGIALGMIVNPQHRNMGFHTTGTCGTLGAAAAACKALDLDQTKIINALGLAGTQAAGLLESDHSGSMGKHLHAGKAAHSGILSALLAENGFTGAPTILEGDEGFIKAMSGFNSSKAIIDSCNDYKIMEVYFKIYPVCRHLHSSIDALLKIAEDERIELNEIKEIKVSTYKIAAEHDNYHPTSTEALRQSLPVSMAVSLLNKYDRINRLYSNEYHIENVKGNKKIAELSERIIIKEDLNLNKKYPLNRPSKVSIQTINDLYEKTVDLPRGEPENPLNKSELIQKFKNLNPKLDMEVINIIEDIDSYDNINNFTADLNSFLLN